MPWRFASKEGNGYFSMSYDLLLRSARFATKETQTQSRMRLEFWVPVNSDQIPIKENFTENQQLAEPLNEVIRFHQ
jgi:hypothetical protein